MNLPRKERTVGYVLGEILGITKAEVAALELGEGRNAECDGL